MYLHKKICQKRKTFNFQVLSFNFFSYLCTAFRTNDGQCSMMKSNRGVAQLVAHLVWDQVVARSSRVTPTFFVPLSFLTGFDDTVDGFVHDRARTTHVHAHEADATFAEHGS